MTIAEERAAAARREIPCGTNIPHLYHLDESILRTAAGAYLCVLRLEGAAFECADDEILNNRHARLNRILLSLADKRITTWQHIVKRKENNYPGGSFAPGFAADLNAKYAARIGGETLLVNELYLTIVYTPGGMENALAKLFGKLSRAEIAARTREHVAHLSEVVNDIVAALTFYDAERLAMYRHNGVLCSEPAEFFGYLVNGDWERKPLAFNVLNGLISTSRPIFGHETIEQRGPTSTRYCAMLGINSYPAQTSPVYLDELLTVPCELVVTQSFAFEGKDSALSQMNRTGIQMENAGDAAGSQIAEIPDAADDVAARRVAMGAHHYSVIVKGDSLRALNSNVAAVRAALTDAGIVTAREDLANEAAFWAQLPGNFAYRPRLSMINSRNLCGFMPLHNFPMGRRDGNHWGDAVTLLLTAAGTPHYLNLHASDPLAAGGGSKKDVAHTLLLGPSGSGKTATKGFLLCMLQKFGLTSILFSKDRDTEILVRRLGGKVYSIKTGMPTGWNPFALDPLEDGTVPYLRKLVRRLLARPRVADNGLEIDTAPLTISEEKDVDQAIASVLRLEHATRRLGRVLDFLPKGELYERLAKWCHAREPGRSDGVNAWVFDNQMDTLTAKFGTARTTGFDVTSFLDDPELRTPINMHLFHLTSRLIDGRRLAVFMSEFWKSLGDPQFAAFAKDLLKTLRMKNGCVVLDSQSPSDALDHPISATLIEQTATKILFPNPEADRTKYIGGLGLSEREFNLIKTDIPEGSGMFLFKQGHHSVVLKLPLDGFDDELAVLSARAADLALMDALIEQYGEDPAHWYPHFSQQRRIA